MQQLTALTSVMTTAAFHASANGEIIESNAPFVQLMRCVPGDNWRMNVDEGDRTLLDSFWENLFANPKTVAQPVAFSVNGADATYQIRAQAVSNEAGEYLSAVGVVIVEAGSSTTRWEIDPATGLPEHSAVFERFEKLTESKGSFVAAVILLDAADSADDTVRKQAARQALSVIRPNDMLASDADGRFLLCAAGINSPAAALAMAERLVNSLGEAQIAARVGLALPNPDVAIATLVREAEAGAWANEVGGFGFAPPAEEAA